MICPILTVSQEVDGQNGARRLDSGSHYRHTPEAGGKVDQANPTALGRAMGQLGIVPAKHNM